MARPTSIQIGARVFRVELLDSEWDRMEIITLAQTAPMQACATLVGRCLPDLGLGAEWIRCQGLPVKFAPRVANKLREEYGINAGEVTAAGLALLEMHSATLLPTAEEVEAARGNAPPPTDEATN